MKQLFLTFLFSSLLSPVGASKPAPYIISQRVTQHTHIVLRLVSRQTKKEIWRYTVSAVGPIAWASDHKSLAAAVDSSSWRAVHILIWKEGKPVHIIPGVKQLRDWGYERDGILNFAWSSDDRRLLFRPWGSGEKDINVASLFCLDTLSNRMYLIARGVSKMQWIKTKRVCYWVTTLVRSGSDFSFTISPHPRYWDCP